MTLRQTGRLGLAIAIAALTFASLAAQGRGTAPAPAAPAAPAPAGGQGRGAGGRGDAPPPPARAAAPIDLTGYWVSVITEDWRWRMVTPPKGDYASLPINMEAKKIADAWDPAKDDAAGEACKAYGAPGLMRLPGRLHITWQDDTTLKVEADAGTQTRVLHFGDWKAPGGAPTRQGETTASWEVPGRGRGANQTPPPPPPMFGNLKTVTKNLSPGYIRKNGVPYSDKTTLTEYWDLLKQPNGDQWIVITTVVEDPTYLGRTWITSLNFKKEPNGSKWDPSPCIAK
jgi:hypothetical protein